MDKVILKKGFNIELDAINFIHTEFNAEFVKGYEYDREGWQYDFGNHRVFVEDIRNYRPTIEIEGDSDSELQSLFAKIGILSILHESIPEVMRKILKK